MIMGMDKYFENFDVIISLSTAGEAPLRNVFEQPDPSLMWTLSHLPVVGVPLFQPPNGMPFGLQVVARKYSDYLLFSFLDELAERELIPEKIRIDPSPRRGAVGPARKVPLGPGGISHEYRHHTGPRRQ